MVIRRTLTGGLWADRDFWAFDEGDRMFWRADGTFTSSPPLGERGWRQHVDFLNNVQFSRDLEQVAEIAAGRVTELRSQFPTVSAVARHLMSSPPPSGESPGWHAFHGGATAALDGDLRTAEQSLSRVVAAGTTGFNWERDLAAQALELICLMGSPTALFNRLVEAIERSRQRFGLPTAHLDREAFGVGG
jgi:hypothetical protein